MDAIGCERQFIDHLAPVWRALPERGRFLTDAALVEYAASRGIEAEAIDADALRRSSRPPIARIEDGPQAFVASIGDTKVARRLGYRRFAFIEHGAGQAYNGVRGMAARHPSYAGGGDREDVELFLVPNDYSADLWRAAYPAARVEVVGSPRLDDLPRRVAGPGPVACVSFHWPAYVCPEAGTALGHYAKVLPELAAAFPGRVIGHAHPKGDWPARMARLYRRWGIPFVADFDEVCRRADVYVCDNSSTIFEFAATGRPVVVLNSPEYRRNVHHGLRFWEAATVGLQVNEPADLIATVQDALQDAPEQQVARESALRLIYAQRAGSAATAAAALRDWARAREMVAA
jgi:hypothetical protein